MPTREPNGRVEEIDDELHVLGAFCVPLWVGPVHPLRACAAGADKHGVAELEVELGDLLELVALDLAPATDVRATRNKAVVVEHLLYLLTGEAVVARELDGLVADLRHVGKGALKPHAGRNGLAVLVLDAAYVLVYRVQLQRDLAVPVAATAKRARTARKSEGADRAEST